MVITVVVISMTREILSAIIRLLTDWRVERLRSHRSLTDLQCETISCRNPVYLLIAIAGTGCAWYNQLLNVCRRQANIRSAAIFQRPTAISRATLPSGQKNYIAIANGEIPLCDFKDVFACGLNTNKPKEIFLEYVFFHKISQVGHNIPKGEEGKTDK